MGATQICLAMCHDADHRELILNVLQRRSEQRNNLRVAESRSQQQPADFERALTLTV